MTLIAAVVRQPWPRRPSPALVAAVVQSPDIMSQVLCHLSLPELEMLGQVCSTWSEAVSMAREERRVLRYEGSLGGSKGSRTGELDLPFFVCVLPNRDVCVADFFNHRLQALSYPRAPSNRVLVGRQPNGMELSCPMGVACDGEHVYVAESGSSCLQKLRLSDWSLQLGTGRHGSSEGELRHPHGLALHGSRLFVADNDNHRVCVFDTQTLHFCFAFGQKGGAKGQLRDPCGLAVHRDVLYVADLGNHRLQAFTVHGCWLRTIGRRGGAPGQFWGPWGVAVAQVAQGAVLCVGESRARRVQVLGLDGTPLQVLTPPGAGSLAGLAVEHRGSGAQARARRVYVADYGNHALLVLSVCDGGDGGEDGPQLHEH